MISWRKFTGIFGAIVTKKVCVCIWKFNGNREWIVLLRNRGFLTVVKFCCCQCKWFVSCCINEIYTDFSCSFRTAVTIIAFLQSSNSNQNYAYAFFSMLSFFGSEFELKKNFDFSSKNKRLSTLLMDIFQLWLFAIDWNVAWTDYYINLLQNVFLLNFASNKIT